MDLRLVIYIKGDRTEAFKLSCFYFSQSITNLHYNTAHIATLKVKDQSFIKEPLLNRCSAFW